MLRAKDIPEMVRMFTDLVNAKSYKEITDELNRRHKALGDGFVYTPMMVRSDITAALKRCREKNEAELGKVWSGVVDRLQDTIREGIEGYEDSRRPDARATASMLKSMMMSGMSYEEAMEKIEGMRFAGAPDQQRVVMEAMDRVLKLYGLKPNAASGGANAVGAPQKNTQVAGTIVNYQGVDEDTKAAMKALAEKLQDQKSADIKKGGAIYGATEEPEDEYFGEHQS